MGFQLQNMNLFYQGVIWVYEIHLVVILHKMLRVLPNCIDGQSENIPGEDVYFIYIATYK